MARRYGILLAGLLVALAGQPRAAQNEKRVHLRGYVVDVSSPTQVTLDDSRISEDRTYRVRLDAAEGVPEALRIGTEVELDGVADPSTGEFHTGSIKPQVEPFAKLGQTTILSRPAQNGLLRADGRRIRIGPATRIIFSKTKQPLASVEEAGPGTAMVYEASGRDPDGTVIADQVEFRRMETSKGERDLWKSIRMEIKDPDVDRHRPGSVRLYRSEYYEIIPNGEIQAYVTDLGWRLVPQYQRDLPDTDAEKIPFRFFVVKRDEPGAAVALPNGVVMVYSRLFDVVENEAQLAALMGHEIAHVTQKHRWQLDNKVDWALGGQFTRGFENQADRLGLEYMVDAGYDPREAPRVLKLITKTFGFVLTNAFQGSHDNNALRRAYLMSELRDDYRGLDYAAMNTEKARFERMAALVKGEVDPGWKAKQPK